MNYTFLFVFVKIYSKNIISSKIWEKTNFETLQKVYEYENGKMSDEGSNYLLQSILLLLIPQQWPYWNY